MAGVLDAALALVFREREDDVRVELLPFVAAVPLAAVRFEQVPAVLREDDGPLVLVDGDEPNQALVSEVFQCVVMRTRIPVADGLQVSLSGHPKRSNGRQCEAVLPVQFVEVLAVVLNQLAVHAARQLQALYERLAWLVVPQVTVTLNVPLSVAWVARFVKPALVMDVEGVAVARVGVVTGIEIQLPSPTASTV